MTDFQTYRDGVGGKVAHTILGKTISNLRTWKEFFAFTYSASCTGAEGTLMLGRAERAYAAGHIGERAVILATLFAMDRSAHAIKLETQANEHLLGLMNYVDAPHRIAVAACMVLGEH